MAGKSGLLVGCVLAVVSIAGEIGTLAAQDVAARNGIIQQWSGRVARPIALEAPIKGFITNAAEFARLWQACQIKGDVPAIDFSQHFILVATARSSTYKVRAVQVDDKGDLRTVVVAAPDMTRDYAIVITEVDRQGVKTVHGQVVE